MIEQSVASKKFPENALPENCSKHSYTPLLLMRRCTMVQIVQLLQTNHYSPPVLIWTFCESFCSGVFQRVRLIVYYRRWISLSFTQHSIFFALSQNWLPFSAYLTILPSNKRDNFVLWIGCRINHVCGNALYLYRNLSILAIRAKNSGSESCFMTRLLSYDSPRSLGRRRSRWSRARAEPEVCLPLRPMIVMPVICLRLSQGQIRKMCELDWLVSLARRAEFAWPERARRWLQSILNCTWYS